MTDGFIKLAEVFQRSNYAISAVGWRGCGTQEIASVLRLIFKYRNSPTELKYALDSLYKYHPDTIELDKNMRARNCQGYVDGCCNCWDPNIESKDYYCSVKRRKVIEDSKRRTYSEYIDWRKKVFERDKYTCQKCGQVGGTLNAHHIKSYKAHPKLRLKLNNGITLCVDCHKEEHRKRKSG